MAGKVRTIAAATPTMPKIAVQQENTTPNGVALIIRISGDSTKMYGMMNAAIASLEALIPVRSGSPPEIPEPA